METDVVGPGLQNLLQNTSMVTSGAFSGSQQFTGPLGTPFNLSVEVTYNQCTNSGSSCPTSIAKVTIDTPGFSVSESSPALPIPAPSGAVEDFNFVITVTPPNSAYNGPLTIVCQTA